MPRKILWKWWPEKRMELRTKKADCHRDHRRSVGGYVQLICKSLDDMLQQLKVLEVV